MKQQEVINFSEFWSLTGCEQRWAYGYLRSLEEPGEKRGLHLGTLIHLGLDRWNRGLGATLPSEWTDDINTGGKPGEERTLRLADFDPEVVATAVWLLTRYVEHYGDAPPSSWLMIDSERWLSTALDELKLLVGRTDGVLEIEGDDEIPDGLWLLERKSYGSKGRLDYVHVDPQLVIYSMLVEAEYGRKLTGVVFDGIYTYRWQPVKPTQAAAMEERDAIDPAWRVRLSKTEQRDWARSHIENTVWPDRPAAESFERRYVDISDEMREVGKNYLYAAIRRRQVLKNDPLQALPNIGQMCRSCGFRPQCWANLRGVEPEGDIEIELYDETEEPV